MPFWQTNEFWNSIIGVLVGGGITWIIQKFDQRYNRNVQNIEALERNKSTAKLLLNKLMRIYSNVSHIGNHIETEYGKAPIEEHNYPHKFVLPLINLPDKINFSDSETELVFSLGSTEFLNKFSDIDHIHNSMIKVMSRYNDLRAELRSHMPVVSMENGVGTSALAPQEAGFAIPIMVELDSLMMQQKENLPKDVSAARIVLNEYIGEINTKFLLSIAIEQV